MSAKKRITIILPDGRAIGPDEALQISVTPASLPASGSVSAPDGVSAESDSAPGTHCGAGVAENHSYEAFLANKALRAPAAGIAEPGELHSSLFPFQADIVRWALRRGRAAVWADCGLGKSRIAIDYGRVTAKETGAPALILTPLAVAGQFVDEGRKMGVEVTHARELADIRAGINVTNYERLHKFDALQPGSVIADESSCLKDFTSATRNALIDRFAATPFRLACTATPAPNDFMELGNHAEFLGVMSRTEMLSMFFVHDGGSTQDWRLKGHARREFWRWIASWAIAIRSPADMGYQDDGFRLPPLNVSEHVVKLGAEFARQQSALFTVEARGLDEQRQARIASLPDRVALAAATVAKAPAEQWLIFCDLNAESEALAAAIPGAVEVRGSDDADDKEKRLGEFVAGSLRVLVTKPSIAGLGLNLQNCARIMFVGLSHSFEAWYQSIRRVYRFGQKRPVECHMITSDAEGAVAANLRRKQADAEHMVAAIVAEMRDFGEVARARRDTTDYRPDVPMVIPDWVGREDAA